MYSTVAEHGQPIESSHSEILCQSARPDLYRFNAFRITQLPVDATTREIARQLDKLKMLEKFGDGASGLCGPLPLDPPPGSDAIREAMSRLHDPEIRLIDEFFWFWPQALGQSKSDPALTALCQGDVKNAAEIWRADEKNGNAYHASMHNMAVLAHSMALDYELTADGNLKILSAEDRYNRDRYWYNSYKRWKRLIDLEGFWSRLSARIRELDDPRLTTGTARRIRATLPMSLMLINAQLALRYAEQDMVDDAQRHMKMVRESDFTPEAIENAIRVAAEPTRNRLKALCKSVQEETRDSPQRADQTANRLIEQASRLLGGLDCLLPANHATRESAHDEVALCVKQAMIAYGNKTENYLTCCSIVEKAFSLAASESVRQKLDEDLKYLHNLVASGDYWCGDGYYDQSPSVLEALEEARAQVTNKQWDKAIDLLDRLLLMVDLGSKACALINKALAFSLNRRACSYLDNAFEQFNLPRSLETKVAARAKTEHPDFIRTAMMAQRGELVPGVDVHCMACGVHITGQYFVATINDLAVIICPRCNADDDRERQGRKRIVEEKLNQANHDLQEARAFDPDNRIVSENIAFVSDTCTKTKIALRPFQVETAYQPEDLGLLVTDRKDAMCWFCDDSRQTDATIRVELYGDVTTVVTRSRRTIRYKRGHVKIPRCNACKAVHESHSRQKAKPETQDPLKTSHKGLGCLVILCIFIGTSVGFVSLNAGDTPDISIPLGIAVFVGSFVVLSIPYNILKWIIKMITHHEQQQQPPPIPAQIKPPVIRKPLNVMNTYPLLQEYFQKGWKLGTKP